MSRFNNQEWVPRTSLGKMVIEGRLTSLTEIFNQGYKIQEPEIIDALVPDLQQEVLDINLVQKQTDAGEKSRFKALVVIGNYDGLFGLGVGKADQVRAAIQKATIDAVFALALGLYTYVNPIPTVTGAPNLVKLLTHDCKQITGGFLNLEKDPIKTVDGILTYIEEKRKKIGI